MYFNFEDYRPDTPTLPRSLTRLEVVLLTVVIYLCLIIFILLSPRIPWFQQWEQARQEALAAQQQEQVKRQRDNARFVFVAPRVDIQAKKAPERAELSDIDRKARTTERAEKPTNSLPFSRGNTFERMEAMPSAEPQRTAPQPEPPTKDDPTKQGMTLPEAPNAAEQKASETPRPAPRGPTMGVIADAIRNVQKYAQKDSFINLQGGAGQEVAPSIQFDTKGVEFGPWIRRFLAQVRRNWFIPNAAWSFKGHVVITFYVGKDGRITELKVLKPSSVDAFNNSSFNALAASNPTEPIPPEYPDDRLFITITFYYNENPGS